MQSALELVDVCVAERRKLFRRHRDEAFVGIIEHDRHILARQPRRGFDRDPVGGHVGGKQRMAGGKHGLVPHIEQGDFIAQQQGGADFRGSNGRYGHESGFLDGFV